MAASAADLVRCAAAGWVLQRSDCWVQMEPCAGRPGVCAGRAALGAAHFWCSPFTARAAQVSEETAGEPLPEPCIAYVLQQVGRAHSGACVRGAARWEGRALAGGLPAWLVFPGRRSLLRSCSALLPPINHHPSFATRPPHPSHFHQPSCVLAPGAHSSGLPTRAAAHPPRRQGGSVGGGGGRRAVACKAGVRAGEAGPRHASRGVRTCCRPGSVVCSYALCRPPRPPCVLPHCQAANILLGGDGGVKVSDFGVSAQLR